MAYVTKQQLIDMFGHDHLVQLTDRNGDGAIDDDVLNDYIAQIENYIDSFLQRRYETPIDPVPPALGMHIMDIVRYRLFLHEPEPEVETRFKQARKWLEDIRENRLDLPGVPLKSSGGGISGYAPERVFTDQFLDGY